MLSINSDYEYDGYSGYAGGNGFAYGRGSDRIKSFRGSGLMGTSKSDTNGTQAETEDVQEQDQGNALAATITRLREERGYATRYALAQAAGVSYTYIEKLEKGRVHRPSIRDLQKVATALGTSAQELMASDTDWQRAAQEGEATPALIQRLIRQYAAETGVTVPRQTADAIEAVLTLFPQVDTDMQRSILAVISNLAPSPQSASAPGPLRRVAEENGEYKEGARREPRKTDD